VKDQGEELDQKPKFNPFWAFFALGILTMVRVVTQWQQKSIGYFYGF